jgi:hypothetical protein
MKVHHNPRTSLVAAISALVVAGASAPPAAAEIYRCTRPDGAVVYSDNKANCPGAGKHEPSGRLQTLSEDAETAPVPGSAEPAEQAMQPAPDAPAHNAEDQRGQKAHWQQLKRTKEAELRALEERHAQIGRFVAACNRGQRIISRDATGIKYGVSCDRIRAEHAETLKLQAPLREYIETGLAQDCRRAGCLPGWLR